MFCEKLAKYRMRILNMLVLNTKENHAVVLFFFLNHSYLNVTKKSEIVHSF